MQDLVRIDETSDEVVSLPQALSAIAKELHPQNREGEEEEELISAEEEDSAWVLSAHIQEHAVSQQCSHGVSESTASTSDVVREWVVSRFEGGEVVVHREDATIDDHDSQEERELVRRIHVLNRETGQLEEERIPKAIRTVLKVCMASHERRSLL